ncbi:MAG: TldD/PmbA family protein [Dehalococcoidales bacterium]
MENILARAIQAAEDAEVFFTSSEETSVHFETNRLKQLQTSQQTGVALRVIEDGRIGYATATGLGDAESLVATALETARFGTPVRFELPATDSLPGVEIFDAGVETVSNETMIKLGEELIAPVIKHTPDIICEAGVTRGTVTVRIINSRGGQANYRKSFFYLGVEGSLIRDTDMLFVGESESSCHPISDSRAVAELVVRQLELARHRATVESKSLPVVFTPNGVASSLIMPLMSAFNGKTVLEGASPLGERLGERVFDSKLSLRDDPLVAYRPGSRPCDDEGVPSQRTGLITEGTVTGFLYDLQTAGLAGKRSTGNGSRGRGGLPSPSPSAFIITPGETTLEEMVGDMKEGLVVEQVMGAEQGNILGGDFSGNVLLGYKVENGKITGRVKDTMISGNVYQILEKVEAIGRDARWVGNFLLTPPVYCSGLSVASK